MLFGGVCGSLSILSIVLSREATEWTAQVSLQGSWEAKQAGRCDRHRELMSLLKPFLLFQPEVHVHLIQYAYLDSGHTGVLASACTLCLVGAVGYGDGGCGLPLGATGTHMAHS